MKNKFFYLLVLFSITFSNAQEEVDSLAIRSKENTAYYNISKPKEKKFEVNFPRVQFRKNIVTKRKTKIADLIF